MNDVTSITKSASAVRVAHTGMQKSTFNLDFNITNRRRKFIYIYEKLYERYIQIITSCSKKIPSQITHISASRRVLLTVCLTI